MIIRPTDIRFGAPPSPRSLGLLVQNCGRMLGNAGHLKLQDLDSVKNNALLISSLIQVTSRILVSNKSAKKAQGTPEGPYRWKEAVRTTMREVLGFGLSYLLLRYVQRGAVDFFRNFLWVKDGIKSNPTIFNGLFRKMFAVPDRILAPKRAKGLIISMVEASVNTAKAMGQEITAYAKGQQKKIPKIQLDSFYPDHIPEAVIKFDDARRGQFNFLKPLINKINQLAGTKDASKEKQLKVFFDWVPALIGSVPAVLLSGFGLEWFSQNYAEKVAMKVATVMGNKNAQAALEPPPFRSMYPKSGFASQQFLPYANGQYNMQGVLFNGLSNPAGLQPETLHPHRSYSG